jgi:hypothetical protein
VRNVIEHAIVLGSGEVVPPVNFSLGGRQQLQLSRRTFVFRTQTLKRNLSSMRLISLLSMHPVQSALSEFITNISAAIQSGPKDTLHWRVTS